MFGAPFRMQFPFMFFSKVLQRKSGLKTGNCPPKLHVLVEKKTTTLSTLQKAARKCRPCLTDFGCVIPDKPHSPNKDVPNRLATNIGIVLPCATA